MPDPNVVNFSLYVDLEAQYITRLGIAEFDDVFGNTLGGWIGVAVYLEAWLNHIKDKRESHII